MPQKGRYYKFFRKDRTWLLLLYNYDSKRETKTKAIWLSYHVQDACMGHLCENGGTCDIQNENVTCVCTPFYGGARCEKKGTL